MPGIQRVGDFNAGGGIIISGGHNNVLVNGRPAARPWSLVTPHFGCGKKGPLHCIALTLPFSSTVRINGQPVVVNGGIDTCLHPRVFGSRNVNAAGGPGLLGLLVAAYSAYTSFTAGSSVSFSGTGPSALTGTGPGPGAGI